MPSLKIWFFLFLLTSILDKAAFADSPKPIAQAKTPATSRVTILDDELKPGTSPLKGDIQIVKRQLLIKGVPFIMKGVCYSPVRKGGIYPNDLITTNPTDEDLAAIEKDFQMMHAAGINTIRCYVAITDPRILDLLTKYQLRTIVPVLSNELDSFSTITSLLLALKDHPSTLIWEVGNEWNLNFFYTITATDVNGIGLEQSVTLLENAAHYIRLMDDTHPISTVMGDLPTDAQFWSNLNFKGIDLYGINVYDGVTFGDRFTRWVATSTKPLYLSEFGADAYNMNIGPINPLTGNPVGAEDDASQAFADGSLIKEIFKNLSATDPKNVLVGGNLFEWNDEWWKSDNSSPDTHDPGNLERTSTGPYPDHVFNEKWFGIVDVDRNPRPAYFTLQKLYLKNLP